MKSEDPENVLIPDQFVKNIITLDFQTFKDKDGTYDGQMGTWGIFANSGAGVVQLGDDMKTVKPLGMIPNTQAISFFEAPFMFERNGIYYFMYSSDSCHNESYKVQYAISDKPFGSEWKMGENNPVLMFSPDMTVDGPGHHSLLFDNDKCYIVYHRHDIPRTPNGMHRQICADEMKFGEKDGVIEKIRPTHRGLGYLQPAQEKSSNLLFKKKAFASSEYADVSRDNIYEPGTPHIYKAEYAFDDNNATLWRPASNNLPQEWLAVDLGKTEKIQRVETQFEYATWYYQYLIEYSLDGKNWSVFADRRSNYRFGSPMIDIVDVPVDARFLRLKILNTEWPGFLGAVWNMKAYSDAPKDELADLATESFEKFVVSTYINGKPGQTAQGFQGAPFVPPQGLLINLDSCNFTLGETVLHWKNDGKLGGAMTYDGNPVSDNLSEENVPESTNSPNRIRTETVETAPSVGIVAGCKAVIFNGKQFLKATFNAPRSLAGSSSFTASAWVCNPSFEDAETVLRWGGRGGPEGNMSQLNFSSNDAFGAINHGGFPDMGFRSPKPETNCWTHIAAVYDGVVEKIYVNGKLNNKSPKMLLVTENQPIFLGSSDFLADAFSGAIASVKLFDIPLSETEIAELAKAPPKSGVLVNVSSAKLSEGNCSQLFSDGSLTDSLEGKFTVKAYQNRLGFFPQENADQPALTALLHSLQQEKNWTAVLSLHIGNRWEQWVFLADQKRYCNGVLTSQVPVFSNSVENFNSKNDNNKNTENKNTNNSNSATENINTFSEITVFNRYFPKTI